MKTIQTRVTISDDRILTLQLPEDIEPGEHTVVINITDEPVNGESRKASLHLKVYHWDPYPADFTYRREDMYDDEGR